MEYQKIAEATDLFGNKIAQKMSKNLKQNKSETIKNEHDKKIPKERYISPEERLYDLRLI